MNMKKLFTLSSLVGVLVLFGLTSCTTYQQQGAGVGALAGAALGALAGDDGGDVIRGATLGAAVGVGAAALTEDSQQIYNTSNNNVSSPSYPYATRTSVAGYVKSPYEPYNTIDVTGIASGKLAKEPGTNNVFIVP